MRAKGVSWTQMKQPSCGDRLPGKEGTGVEGMVVVGFLLCGSLRVDDCHCSLCGLGLG